MNSHFVKQLIQFLYGDVGYIHNNHLQNLICLKKSKYKAASVLFSYKNVSPVYLGIIKFVFARIYEFIIHVHSTLIFQAFFL